jgi:glycosyltransferase involved in cell wall biosynthesis
MNVPPPLTVAIPTYNEERHIERVVRTFQQTTYSNLVEILVVDGGSSDDTQHIVQRLSRDDPRVRLLHNPLKIQSAALNIAIAEAQGEIFLRADAHSEYATDYVEQCVEALKTTEAVNVGGAQRFVARTPFQAGVAVAAKSILGNGRAKYREPTFDGYADTVYLGCFWKWAFEQLDRSHLRPTNYRDAEGQEREVPSIFDLGQVANQDAELNLCLRERFPRAIYVSSKIRAWYYPRTTLRALWRQFFRYGRGRCRTVNRHAQRSPIRGKLPFLILSTALVIFLIDVILFRGGLGTIYLALLGIVAILIESARATWALRDEFATEIWRGEESQMPSLLQRWWYCSVALISKPCAHFAGFGYQLFRIKVLKVQGW